MCPPLKLILGSGARWGYLLFQGLLKMEDVALPVSPGRSEVESPQVKVCGDERQDDGGALTSLGKTDGHRFLLRFPGFLCVLEPPGCWSHVFGFGITVSKSCY